MTRLLSLTFVVLLMTSVSGCDNSNPDGDAPELIAPDLFQIDTSFFSTSPQAKTQSKVNFTNAAFRVWPVSLVMSASLVLPAAVTAAAVQAEPNFSDGAWRWESVATFNQSSVTFGLIATPDGNGHNWSAVLSFYDATTQTQLDDFELYSGRTQNGGTEGNWQLYLPTESGSMNVLDASFTRNSETDKSVTFMIPTSAAENAGDAVTYTENGNERGFVWEQVAQGIMHSVEWNASTGAGSITATNFNNGVQGCWDSNQDDVACPAGS